MPKHLRLLPLLLFGLHAATAADAPASWAFVESLGGMAVGQPQPDESGGWRLPLSCDLTGLQHVSVDPSALNTTQVIDRVQWRIREHTLTISLFLRPSSYATDAARCTPLLLQGLKPGVYEAVYQDGARSVIIGKFRLDR